VRSLATSFCTMLPVLALFLFGGETLKDFAFALLIGTLSGTYSSVFIAGPVLTYWKSREPVYRAREARIRAQFDGEVPAYAVATAGAPVDVAPKDRGRRRDRLTQPVDPATGVSRAEFDEMVRDLGVEEDRQPAATGSGLRPAGGRRARSRSQGGTPPPTPPSGGGSGSGSGGSAAGGSGSSAAGDDKPKKPRNRRHGRPR
jgi:SecD/SecF fusion protein